MKNQPDIPVVSIIIPVHNGEKYIKEALDSCLKQSFKDFEIIAVNDASTDNTLNILSKYVLKDSRIKVLTVSKKENLGEVINEGIRVSRGKYIARMDADDVMTLDRLEKQVSFLEINSRAVLVGGQLEIIDENGKIKGIREYALEDRSLRKNLFLFQPFAHPAITIRKSALEAIGLYPEDTKKVEDTKLMFLLSQIGEFANLPIPVLKYRVTYNSESQLKMVDHFKRTDAIRRWAIKKLGIKPSFREYILWYIQRIFVSVFGVLPNHLFLSLFEIGRKILK